VYLKVLNCEAIGEKGRYLRQFIVEIFKSMAKKLYVGGLSYSTTEDGLRDAFSKAGTVVSANILLDKMTGKSRGFGFVEMEDADAGKAIDMFNGQELDGRKLTVNEARPMAERPPRSGGFGGGDRGRRSY
jgi:cold-inducible RNA-binding protein